MSAIDQNTGEITRLPITLQEMDQLIGTKAVFQLVEKYGGIRFYVPQKIHADHELAKLIGMEAAEKLAREYGGSAHEIPRALLASIDRRNQEIKNEYKTHSQRQLARKYGLTERQIRNIVGEKTDERQLALFDETEP